MLDRFDDVLNLLVEKKYDSADKLLANMLISEEHQENIDKNNFSIVFLYIFIFFVYKFLVGEI